MNQNTPANNKCDNPPTHNKEESISKSGTININNKRKHAEDHSDRCKARSIILSVIALIVSITSAGFAYWQLTIAKDTAQKQLRAYVYASPNTLYHLGENPTQGYLTVRNGGHTFANKVSREVGINVLSKDIPNSFEKLGRLKREPGYMTLGPNTGADDVIYREYRVLTDDEIKQINSGDKRIYVFGKITYEDIYDIRHETTFCFMYYGNETSNVLASQGRSGYDKTQAEYCDKYNFAD